METIYTSASCYDCETSFGSGREATPLSEAFIKKVTQKDGWFKCPVCGEGMEMGTAEYDEEKRYFVIRYWMFKSTDGRIRPDVVWTDCGGSWTTALEQQAANMQQKDVVQSLIVRCFKDESKKVQDEDLKLITNL